MRVFTTRPFLFLLFANLMVVYLLYSGRNNSVVFELIMIFVSLILLFYLMFSYYKIKNKKQFLLKIQNSLSISFNYLSINKKYIFITITGIFIAVIIISQSILLPLNMNEKLFQQHLSENDTQAIELNVKYYPGSPSNAIADFINWQQLSISKVSSLMSSMEFKEVRTDVFPYMFDLRINGHKNVSLENYTQFIPLDYAPELGLTEWSEDYHDKLNKYTNFDYNPEEKIIVINDELQFQFPNLINDIHQNNRIQIITRSTLDKIEYNDIYFDRIIQLSQADYYELCVTGDDICKKNAINLFYPGGEVLNLFNNLFETNVDNDLLPKFIFAMRSYIEIPLFYQIDLPLYVNNLRIIISEFNSWELTFPFSPKGTLLLSIIDSPLMDTLEIFESKINSVNNIFQLYILPILAISLYLGYYSFTMIETRISKIFQIMKQKGLKSSQAIFILSIENLAGSLIAIFGGMSLSIFAANWFLFQKQTNDFSNSLIIPDDYYWKVPFFILVLAFDINFPNMLKLSRISMDEENYNKEKTHSFYKKLRIDLYLFIGVISYFLILNYFQIYNRSTYDTLKFEIGSLLLVFFIILIPLIIKNYIANSLIYIIDRIEKTKKGLLLIITRNINFHTITISKFLSLMIICITLISVSLNMNSNFNQWTEERQHYNLGADIFVSGQVFENYNESDWDILSIEGVEAYTEIRKFNAIINTQFGTFNSTFLGINPDSFAAAAFWNDDYGDLELIIDSLNKLSIGFQEEILKSLGTKVGNRLSIKIDEKNSIILDISSNYSLFPNLVDEKLFQIKEGVFEFSKINVLSHYDLYDVLSAIPNSPEFLIDSYGEFGAYIKVKPEYEIDVVATNLRDNLRIDGIVTVSTITGEISKVRGSVSFLANSFGSFLTQFILGIVLIINFSFYILKTINSRRRELSIFRTYGIQNKQIFQIFTFEIIILVFWSLLLSYLLMLFLSPLLFDLIISNATDTLVLSYKLKYSYNVIFLFSIIILLLGLISSIVIGRYYTKIKPGEILRTE